MDEEEKSGKKNRKQKLSVCHNHYVTHSVLAVEQLLCYSMNLKNDWNNGSVSAGS